MLDFNALIQKMGNGETYSSLIGNNSANMFSSVGTTGAATQPGTNAMNGFSGLSSLFGNNGNTNVGYTTSAHALSSQMSSIVGQFTSNIPLDQISNYSDILLFPQTQNAEGGSVWGGIGYGQGQTQTAGSLFGYLGGTDSAPSANYQVPIYEDRYEEKAVYNYVEYQAWDYDFQVGQNIHQTNDTQDVQVTSINRDPVILDLDFDGQLGVTGKDSSQEKINFTTSSTQDVTSDGSTTTTTTNTHEEWDLLVDWKNKIDFDVDGDGTVDRTEWMKEGSGDGFVVLDADGDGKINGRELMNETGLDGEQNKYASGWDKAKDVFDTDGDGILKGDELANVKIWKDANGDGVTDEGELVGVADLGITEINTNKGSFTRQELAGYETVHTREQVGYTEYYCYAGMNDFGVGHRTVINGEVVDSNHLG